VQFKSIQAELSYSFWHYKCILFGSIISVIVFCILNIYFGAHSNIMRVHVQFRSEQPEFPFRDNLSYHLNCRVEIIISFVYKMIGHALLFNSPIDTICFSIFAIQVGPTWIAGICLVKSYKEMMIHRNVNYIYIGVDVVVEAVQFRSGRPELHIRLYKYGTRTWVLGYDFLLIPGYTLDNTWSILECWLSIFSLGIW